MELLHRLRAKPERERKQIAIAATVALWGVIMFVWLTSSVLRRAPVNAQPALGESPIEAMGSIFGEGVDGIRGSVSSAYERLRVQKPAQ